MARKKRKIGFHYLTVTNENLSVYDVFQELLVYLNGLERHHRSLNLGANKFCLLDFSEQYPRTTKTKIVMKSATHSFRPNLMHNVTANERESPKDIREGEVHKTHILTKRVNGDVILLLEKSMDGISMNQFITYLNHFSLQLERDELVVFNYETMIKDDFLEEVERLDRVVATTIKADKQILGSEALNFSNRINEVKYDIEINVKARRSENIKNFVRDIYANLNGGRTAIRRITVKGKTDDQNDVVINTDAFERQEYINPEIDQMTGELRTTTVFIDMNPIIDTF